jgi:polyhydroxyalkanoate synthesis regulator phasin
MAKQKHWSEMTVEERLEALKRDEELRQREMAAMAKTLQALTRRLEDLERRFEESLFN